MSDQTMWLVSIGSHDDSDPIGLFYNEEDARAVETQVEDSYALEVKVYQPSDRSLRHEKKWIAGGRINGRTGHYWVNEPKEVKGSLVDSDGVIEKCGWHSSSGEFADGMRYVKVVADTAEEAYLAAEREAEKISKPLRAEYQEMIRNAEPLL